MITEKIGQILDRAFELLGRFFSRKWVRITTYVFMTLSVIGNISTYIDGTSPNGTPMPLGELIAALIIATVIALVAYYFGKNPDGPNINFGGGSKGNGSTKRKLTEEEKVLVKDVRSAKRALASATRVQKKTLSAAKRELEELRDPKGRRVASGGGVQVFQRWIVTPQGSGSIIGVTASAEDNTSIHKRITATRMVGLGIFALAAPKKRGGGNAYVVIDGPHINGVAIFSGDKQQTVGPKAFALAASINNAARQAATDEPLRPSRIKSVEEKISVIESAPEIAAASLALHSAIEALPLDLQSSYR